jgi:sec-independent protein translocase protein TatC
MALVPFPQKNATAPDREPDWDDPDEHLDDSGKMSFLEHLDELRRRIIWSLGGVVAGMIVAAFYLFDLFDFVLDPMQSALPAGQTLISTEPTELFSLYIKVLAIAGLLIASPLVMSQVWLFIAPGLYAHEKKLAIPFVVMSSVFFIAGAAFCHFVVFPMTWQFFIDLQIDGKVEFTPRIGPAFALWTKLIIAFGLVFQLPTVVLFLAKMGLITARFMLRKFKYAVLAIFIIAAIITPDGSMVTQAAMAGPMILLYLLGVALAWIFGKKREPLED